MSRGSLVHVSVGTWLADAAFPPAGWWIDYPGMGRYYSTPTNNPKNLTHAEIVARAEADDAGFMLFVEQSETTPTTGSRDANIRLADQGAAMATDHGAVPGTPLMFAVDTEARPYMDAVRGNFVLYRQRVPAEFPLWAYAGSDVIDQLISDGTITGGHIPAALSWSSTRRPVDNVEVFRHSQGFNYYITPAASMLQFPSEPYRGGRIDRNRVIGRKPVPLWYPGRTGGPPPPLPPSSLEGDDMRWFVTNTESFPQFVNDRGEQQTGPEPGGSFPAGAVVWEIQTGGKRHVGGAEYFAVVGTTDADKATFAKLFHWEGWTTGRIQSMPNVPAAGQGAAGREAKAIHITSVPGDASVVY